MTKIKGVLLDLDNTLYNYDICNTNALKKVFLNFSRKYRISPNKIKGCFYNARKQVKSLLEGTAASHSRLLYFKMMIEKLKGSTDPELSLYCNDVYWKEYFKYMNLSKNAKKLLIFCQNKGIKIAIITNLTTEIQFKKIVYLGISKYISLVITSEEVGKEKPNPKIFYVALNKLNCKPKEVIMIDDNERDILGAKKLGFKVYKSFDDIPKKFYKINIAKDF